MRGAFQVFFGFADGTRAVNGIGDFGADVAVGHGAAARSQQTRRLQNVDPFFPVFAAHDFDGAGDVFFIGGFDGDFADGVVAEIDGFAGVGLADGFERRGIERTVFRVEALGAAKL